MKRMFLQSLSIALVAALVPTRPASAFKVETHIWIAQQIIDELAADPDGRLVFDTGGQVANPAVPTDIRRAILAHPAAFRMGSVGPDALPGVYEGQMSIHPGKSPAWGTGGWLRHVLRAARTDEERAFAYGLIAHAAADIWAHSYVNPYAGGVWALNDGETVVETRHFLLEGYLAAHAPALKPAGSAKPVAPDKLIRRPDGSWAFPAGFVYQVFVGDPAAAAEFGRTGSKHIYAVHKLNRSLARLARDGGPADDLHHVIQKAVIERLSGYAPSDAALKEMNTLHAQFLKIRNEAVGELHQAHDEYRAAVRRTIGEGHAAAESALDEAARGIDDAAAVLKRKDKIENEIIDTKSRLAQAVANRGTTKIKEKYCLEKVILGECPGGWLQREVEKVVKTQAERNERALLTAHRRARGAVIGELNRAVRRVKSLMVQAHKASLAAYDAETKTHAALQDLDRRLHEDENPLKSLLRNWRADSIAATAGYFTANVDAVLAAMRHADPLPPLDRWAKCQAPSILGVPSGMMAAGCATKDAVGELNQLLELAEAGIIEGDPVAAKARAALLEFRASLIEDVKDEGFKLGDSILGTDFRSFLKTVSRRPTAATVNAAFMQVPDTAALMKVPKAAQRAKVDMGVSAKQPRFDPAKFAVIRHSLVLVRLSLLDATGVNEVADASGNMGEGLPSGADILSQFASSIDGDHQWLPQTPPYLRSDNNHVRADDYGYPGEFVLWQLRDHDTGPDRLFRKLFRSPIAPSLADLLPTDYPYRPRQECPFPNYPEPDVCPSKAVTADGTPPR